MASRTIRMICEMGIARSANPATIAMLANVILPITARYINPHHQVEHSEQSNGLIDTDFTPNQRASRSFTKSIKPLMSMMNTIIRVSQSKLIAI